MYVKHINIFLDKLKKSFFSLIQIMSGCSFLTTFTSCFIKFDMKIHNPPKYLLFQLIFLQLLIDLKPVKVIPKSGPIWVSDKQKRSMFLNSFGKSGFESLLSLWLLILSKIPWTFQ